MILKIVRRPPLLPVCLVQSENAGGRRFLAGNRCSKPVRTEAAKAPRNLYADKLSLLDNYRQDAPDEGKQTIGIPMGLNFYDLLPFWYAFFHALGFRVLVSPNSTRELYAAGQLAIGNGVKR